MPCQEAVYRNCLRGKSSSHDPGHKWLCLVAAAESLPPPKSRAGHWLPLMSTLFPEPALTVPVARPIDHAKPRFATAILRSGGSGQWQVSLKPQLPAMEPVPTTGDAPGLPSFAVHAGLHPSIADAIDEEARSPLRNTPAPPCLPAATPIPRGNRHTPADASRPRRAHLRSEIPSHKAPGLPRIVRERSFSKKLLFTNSKKLRIKNLSQCKQSCPDAGLHRPQCVPRLRCNFRMTQALEIRHLQSAALCWRHTAQRAANFFHATITSRVACHIGMNRDHYVGNVGLRMPLAHHVNGAVARNHGQPWTQASAPRIEAAWISPELHEDVLQYVLGCTRFAQHSQSHRVHNPRVPVVQHSHRALVARAHRRHESFVVSRSYLDFSV